MHFLLKPCGIFGNHGSEHSPQARLSSISCFLEASHGWERFSPLFSGYRSRYFLYPRPFSRCNEVAYTINPGVEMGTIRERLLLLLLLLLLLAGPRDCIVPKHSTQQRRGERYTPGATLILIKSVESRSSYSSTSRKFHAFTVIRFLNSMKKSRNYRQQTNIIETNDEFKFNMGWRVAGLTSVVKILGWRITISCATILWTIWFQYSYISTAGLWNPSQ